MFKFFEMILSRYRSLSEVSIERDVFHVKRQEVDSAEVRVIKLTGNESVSVANIGIC